MSTPPPSPTIAKQPTTFEIGQTLGHSNQFKIVKRIGQGGCGEVFLAVEERAQRHVAIKTLLPQHNSDKKMLRRFKAEYTIGALLSHPGLVQMFDLYESPEGIHYIVMEYIDGESLSARMYSMETAEGQLGVDEAMNVGWQVASLFDQLHERSILHRDLKPGNILVVKDPTIRGGVRYKLIDFGIAKLIDKSQAQSLQVDNETTTGSILGTIQVMSPETFIRPKEQGPAADVYALGCMLYRAIAGSYPFSSKSDMEIIYGHMTQDPIPLTAEDPLIPRDVADIIHRMIGKDPAKRPTMREVSEFFARKLGQAAAAAGQILVKGGAQDLQAVLGDVSSGGPTSTASGPLVLAVSEAPSVQGSQILAAQPTRLSHRRQRTMVGLALGVAALLATGAFILRSLSTKSLSAHSASAAPTQPASLPLSASSDKVAGPAATAADMGSHQGPAPAAASVVSSGRAIKSSGTKHRQKKKDSLVVSDE